MKKVLVIPASFKGSLTSIQAADIMEQAIRSGYPDCEIIKIPISDGGEGLVDCFMSFHKGTIIKLNTTGPDNKIIPSFYGLMENNLAVIEMAASAGLLLTSGNLGPGFTTTLGVGELISDAINRNAKTIYLGLGGSATNDAGCGIAHALGVRFFDKDRNVFIPTGATLDKINDISTLKINSKATNAKIICFSDVTNPLYGPNGAAHIFAWQKGADQNMVELLDKNLKYYADFLENKFNFSSSFPGAGASGGIPVSMKAFFNATVKSGINTILELLSFLDLLKSCDCVFTGEGKLDGQSLQGKAISGIASFCNSSAVPLYAFVGKIEGLKPTDYPDGLTKAVIINPEGIDQEVAIHNAKSNLYVAVSDFVLKH